MPAPHPAFGVRAQSPCRAGDRASIALLGSGAACAALTGYYVHLANEGEEHQAPTRVGAPAAYPSVPHCDSTGLLTTRPAQGSPLCHAGRGQSQVPSGDIQGCFLPRFLNLAPPMSSLGPQFQSLLPKGVRAANGCSCSAPSPCRHPSRHTGTQESQERA